MATPFWEAGAFGARAARIKTRISYVHRISSYRRCARPWAFTNMSGETPYFDFFFVSIRSARRGSTRSRYLFNSSAGVAMTIASTAGRITCFLLALSSRFFNSSLQLSNADLTAAITCPIDVANNSNETTHVVLGMSREYIRARDCDSRKPNDNLSTRLFRLLFYPMIRSLCSYDYSYR